MFFILLVNTNIIAKNQKVSKEEYIGPEKTVEAVKYIMTNIDGVWEDISADLNPVPVPVKQKK